MSEKNIKQIIRVNYLQPAFLVCAGVLLVAACALSAAVKLSGIYLKKEPLPLKHPLSELDTLKLDPYKVVAKQNIDNRDVVETLGTEDYIQWVLEDTDAAETSSIRFCTLFITYYELPDLVPHVPEECYTGGGYRQKSSEIVPITINKGGIEQQINARYLVFTGTDPGLLVGEVSFPIFYIFSVNGEYASGRTDTRYILNKNIFGKYSYFSKVEWKFYNNRFGRIVYPNRQEATTASAKLLKVILPILEKEHWPSIETAEQQATNRFVEKQ
jgi:hypothetical protein